MTDPGSAAPFGQLPRDDLTACVSRALYQRFDLRTVGGTYVVVPKGTPCFAGPSLGDIARQISDHEHPDPAAPASGTPANPG
jgi:hypothetical protein